MNSAADDAAAGSSDPVIEVSSRATGHWNPSPPAAHASVGLTAVDALPLDVDVPIVIYATTELHLDPVLDRIELRTRISWAAHDFITEFSSGAIEIVEDEVSKAILDKLKPRPGQQEVERGERHVVYRSERPLMEPVTSLFSATLDNHILTAAGVGATGPVKVYPSPVAHFTLEDQHWESGLNCNARRWETKFVPPKVHIFGVDRFYGLRFLAHPTVDPAGFWVPQVSWSGFGPGNQIAHVTFDVPPFGAGGLRPVGQVSSGFMVTNLGVRWVDLGAVPVQPAAPADPVGIQVFVYNKCLQLVDPWGRGVLNLDWLVDPPDLDLGMPPLREWTLVGTQIFEVDRIGLAAVGPAGERQLAVVPVRGNSVFAQVVTDADETLEVRSRVALSPTPPQIMQRWIVPWSSAPVGSDTRELAISDGDLLVLDRESVSQIKLPGSGRAAMTHRLEPGKLPARLAARLHQSRSNAEFSAPRTVGNGRSVAVLHRGMVVVGFAGPLVRVTEGLSRARG
jgi:hypothetical protein